MKIMWYDWKLIDAVSKVENELWTSAPVALFKSALHFPEYTCLCGAYCDVFPLGVSFIEVCVGWEPKYFNQAHLFKSNIFFFFFLPEHYLFNLTGYNRGTVCLHLKYLFCWCFMMFFFFLLGGKCKHQVLLWGRRHRIVSLLSVQAWLSFSSLNSVCPVVSLNIKES